MWLTRTLSKNARSKAFGADVVLEAGAVTGIGLAGAAVTMHKAGYVFSRVAGTSAGAIVAVLMAAYQSPQAAAAGVDLGQIEADMRELDYHRFMETSWPEGHLLLTGKPADIIEHQGMYKADFLAEWLSSKLDPGVVTIPITWGRRTMRKIGKVGIVGLFALLLGAKS